MTNNLFTRLNLYCRSRIFLVAACLLGLVVVTLVIVCVIVLRSSGKTAGSQVNPTTGTTSMTTTAFSTSTASSTFTTSGPIDLCEIDPNVFDSVGPLLIDSGTSSLIYPKAGDSTAKFSPDDEVEISCVNGQVVVNGEEQGNTVKATCQSGQTFSINEKAVAWSTISCSTNILPTVLNITRNDIPSDDPNQSCHDPVAENLVLGTIGFTIDSTRIANIVYICFNTTSRITLFSNYKLTGSIQYKAKNVKASTFKQDPVFYNDISSVRLLYTNNQTTINKLLGLETTSEQYVNETSYINRGQLGARADFYYAASQNAVYRYVNVAPQWSSINGGNWNQLENDVRDYVTNNNVDLQVWTGTYGISTLDYVNSSQPVELYLYYVRYDINSPSFSIPEVFWKILYNPLNSSGVVFVGHNNPYRNVTADQRICTDVSDRISWLKWDKDNVFKGYSYACDYNDNKFHNLVSFAPKLNVKSLLV